MTDRIRTHAHGATGVSAYRDPDDDDDDDEDEEEDEDEDEEEDDGGYREPTPEEEAAGLRRGASR